MAIMIYKYPEIIDFRRGVLEEKISLYADNTLLYLGNTDGSLQAIMSLINNFGDFLGFSINWNKLVIISMDPLHHPLPDCAQQIQTDNAFKYLWVIVPPDPGQYLKLTQVLLLDKHKVKCNSWCKLPLLVVGRVYLIKIVLALHLP